MPAKKALQQKNNKQTKQKTENITLKWHTPEQVFKKKTSKKFTEAYEAEKARISVARTIRQARIARKITQSQLAKRTAMPQSAIARLESGNHSVSFETLSKVAYALGKEVKIV